MISFDHNRYHLVLGGTRGIGAAYARLLARQGARLILIGRESGSRNATAQECRELGSSEIRTEAVDLSNATVFNAWLAKQDDARFESVFLGGPSPTPGDWTTVGSSEHAHAAWVCVGLPAMLLQWLRGRTNPDEPVKMVWLGSHVTWELESKHRFFLSGLYRRTTRAWLDSVNSEANWIRVKILEPKVVESGLSLTYAATRQGRLVGSDPERMLTVTEREALRNFLAQDFSIVSVPTSDEFVAEQMSREEKHVNEPT